MGSSNLITSKELMEKTGISRATLNNYIKMGILPKPIVRKPGPEQQGVKQIGYFPISVLENILKVKLLKQQGNSMDEIATIFQESSAAEVQVEERDYEEVVETVVEKKYEETIQPPFVDEDETYTAPPQTYKRTSESDLKVTISDINSPAYLINHNFQIEWINRPAEELIFNHNVRNIIDAEMRNVFRLMLHEDMRKKLSNWKEAILLHLTVLQNRISENNFHSMYEGISENDNKILADLFAEKIKSPDEKFYHLPISLVDIDNARSSYFVHTMSFREGTFFVYVPADSLNTALLDMLSQRRKIITDLLRNRMPSLVSLCVLIADLQDSSKISAELLPSQYFELINDLWHAVGPTFEKYNGIYGKHAGDGMLYYFIHKPGVNYLMNSVNCAIEIREIMKELSSKWRLRKGWDNELFLNIGINEGQEFFGTIQSSNNIEFTALGDTINIASRISDLARDGEIWTTKNLISRLTRDERRIIRFGIHQENQKGKMFIRNSFSRISDLIRKENLLNRHLTSIAGLPITEIKERVHHNLEMQDKAS